MNRWLACGALLLIASISSAGLLEPITVDSGVDASASIVPVPIPGHPIVLPTRYFADRFIVEPVTLGGQPLSFFTDSGGGLFIDADAIKKLGLTPSQPANPEDRRPTVSLPEFSPDYFIPSPLFQNAKGLIPVDSSNSGESHDFGNVDGMLGTSWFGGRTWTFDYPNQRLVWRADSDTPSVDPSHTVRLGFKPGEAFPRIDIQIDGAPISLLFDTGASLTLTDKAAAQVGDGGPVDRATSFIDESVFNRWTARHPSWRVIKHAEKGVEHAAIIEVPQITVAGYTIGPVWFTRRKNVDFKWMSSFTDQHIDGALGGDALRHFRITVDYPSQTAYFER